MMTPKTLLYSLGTLVLFAFDRLFKHLALSGAQLGEPGGLQFTLFRNDGIAFSLPLSGALYWLLALPFAAILLVLLVRKLRAQDPSAPVVFLILAGAVSNMIDRLHYGAVIDYLIFPGVLSSQGAVNLADAMIVAGLLLLIARPPLTAKTRA